MKGWSVGIDLGGTKIEIGFVDPQGKIAHHITLATDVSGGPIAILHQIVYAIQQLESFEKEEHPISCIGAAVPGQVTPEGSIVLFAPNLRWHDIPFKEMLETALGIPTILLNDVRAATWGEWLYGAGQGGKHLICLFVGTGVGGGIISNGRIVEGINNSAGEIGHMVIQRDGPPCTCGNKGCLEALAGGWAIGKIASEATGKEMTAKQLFTAFKEGDPLAQSLVEEITHSLALGVSNLVNLLNPEKVILGGGVINHNPELIAKVEEGVRKRALLSARKKLKVVESKCKGEAGVLGAAAFAQSTLCH